MRDASHGRVLTDARQGSEQTETQRQLTRELRALSECNQTLLRAVDEQTLLCDICRIICDVAGYRMAWVGYVEHDPAKTVRPVAWAGAESGYIAKAKLSWSEKDPRGCGPGGAAIRSRRTVYIEDVTTDIRMEPWRSDALARGFRSVVGLPLKDRGSVFGVLLVYSAERQRITRDEVHLLEELAGDLAYGTTALRSRVERERAEEMLRRREQEFRSLAENLPDQITRFDTSGRMQYVSPSVLRTYGVTADQVLGKTIMEVRTPGGPVGDRRFLDAVRKAAATGESNRMEATWMTPAGERHVEVRHVPEKDPNGKVTSVLGIVRDVTEQRRAEENLRESEEKFRRIVATASEGIWLLGLDAQTTFVNARMSQMLGYRPDELMDRLLSDFMFPEEIPDHEARMRRRRAGRSEQYERRFRHKSGRSVWTLVSATPILDDRHKFAGSFGMITDITERKQAEERLRQSEAMLRDIIENTNAAIHVTDASGRLVLVNQKFAKTLGLRAKDAMGQPLASLSGEMANALVERERRVLAGGRSLQVEETLMTAVGECTYVSLTFPLTTATGDVYAVCGISTDITSIKLAEEELRQKDQAIRKAYVDVIAAVTGNKLVLMTPEEIDDGLGTLLGKSRTIRSYRSMASVRGEIREEIEPYFADEGELDGFIVGVGEGLTNAIKHGGGGNYEARARDSVVQVVIRDKGRGVDFTTLPRATLEAGFSTKGTLGLGFTIMLEMADRVLLSTQPSGTILVLERATERRRSGEMSHS